MDQVSRTGDSRVPVFFGDPVEAGEHDGQDDAGVLLDQTHDVLVVPVVESPLSHLHTHTHTHTHTLIPLFVFTFYNEFH